MRNDSVNTGSRNKFFLFYFGFCCFLSISFLLHFGSAFLFVLMFIYCIKLKKCSDLDSKGLFRFIRFCSVHCLNLEFGEMRSPSMRQSIQDKKQHEMQKDKFSTETKMKYGYFDMLMLLMLNSDKVMHFYCDEI